MATSITYILAPTDFSANAFDAAKYACALAVKMGWQIKLCHAYMPFYSGFLSQQQNSMEKEAAKKAALDKMDELMDRLRSMYPSLSIECTCQTGHVAKIIVEESKKVDARLIVMGTKGAAELNSRLIGSNTYAIISESAIPVLAIPKGRKELQFQRFGFATNYHAAEIAALYDLIALMGNQIDILPFHLQVENAPESEAYMNDWITKTNSMIAYRPLEFRLSDAQSLVTGIVDFAEQEKLDMLVMTKSKKGILNRLLGRDLISAIVHNPPIPVLVITER